MAHPSLSLENMVDSLFGAPNLSYGFESEDLTPEETEIVEGTSEAAPEEVVVDSDPELTEELAEDAAQQEEVEVTAECYRLLGDAASMSIALRTAESYVWSLEGEEEGSSGFKAALKKFWEWIKGIVEKIKGALVNFYRRVTIWLAGDMKKYAAFYGKLTAEQKTKIENSSVELNTKLLIDEDLKDMEKEVKTIEDYTENIKSMCKIIEGGKCDDMELKIYDVTAKDFGDLSVSEISERLYGKNAKATKVTAKKFFSTFSLSNLADAEVVKKQYKALNEGVKASQKIISAAVKAGAKVDGADVKNIKKLGSIAQRTMQTTSTAGIYNVSQTINLISTAYRFAQKALKGGEAKK